MAAAEPDATMRSLEAVAVVREALRDLDVEPVIVGGLAVSYWTRGAYLSPEADLLLPSTRDVESRLVALGFVRSGRHWRLPDTEIEIEAPGDFLGDSQLTREVALPSGRSVRLLAPEEMLVERLREFVVWHGQSEPFRQSLYLLGSDELDVELARRRADQEGLREALAVIEETARKVEEGQQFSPREIAELARRLEQSWRSKLEDDDS